MGKLKQKQNYLIRDGFFQWDIGNEIQSEIDWLMKIWKIFCERYSLEQKVKHLGNNGRMGYNFITNAKGKTLSESMTLSINFLRNLPTSEDVFGMVVKERIVSFIESMGDDCTRNFLPVFDLCDNVHLPTLIKKGINGWCLKLGHTMRGYTNDVLSEPHPVSTGLLNVFFYETCKGTEIFSKKDSSWQSIGPNKEHGEVLITPGLVTQHHSSGLIESPYYRVVGNNTAYYQGRYTGKLFTDSGNIRYKREVFGSPKEAFREFLDKKITPNELSKFFTEIENVVV